MNEAQRQALQARIVQATKAAKKMKPAAARERLIKEGFYNEAGELDVRYGGKAVAHG